MTPVAILREAYRHGADIAVAGGSLRLTAPRPLPDSLVEEIRRHKPEIIEALSPLPHGPCIGCGKETRCMLTRPDGSWDWMCIPCFDRSARPLPEPQKAHSGEMVKP